MWSLENPLISFPFAFVIALIFLWLGSDLAVRNYRAKALQKDLSPYEATGLASILASLFLSTGILLYPLQNLYGENWGFIWTVTFFLGLMYPCETFRQFLAQKREPGIKFR